MQLLHLMWIHCLLKYCQHLKNMTLQRKQILLNSEVPRNGITVFINVYKNKLLQVLPYFEICGFPLKGQLICGDLDASFGKYSMGHLKYLHLYKCWAMYKDFYEISEKKISVINLVCLSRFPSCQRQSIANWQEQIQVRDLIQIMFLPNVGNQGATFKMIWWNVCCSQKKFKLKKAMKKHSFSTSLHCFWKIFQKIYQDIKFFL